MSSEFENYRVLVRPGVAYHHSTSCAYRLVGDPHRVSQILCNLLQNAAKFTEQGEICLTVTSSLTDDQRTVRTKFVLTDTGIGISQQQLRHLFQPFSQGDSSSTRRFGGTGLGLGTALLDRLLPALSDPPPSDYEAPHRWHER